MHQTADAPVRLTESGALRSVASASGALPFRVAITGGRLLGPSGSVRDQRIAGALATALATELGHGIDVEALDTDRATAAATAQLLADRDLSHTDALIIVLEPEPGARSVDVRVRVGRLVEDVTRRLAAGCAVVVALPPASRAGVSPRELDLFEASVRESVDALVRVVRLEEGFGAADGRTTTWAGALAGVAASALTEPMVSFLPSDPFDDDLRVDALEALSGSYGSWTQALQTIVDLARTTYGTSAAAMSLIDDERTHYFTRSGNVAVSLPRGKTVCNKVMKLYGGLIVGDAAVDPRLAPLPEVRTRDVVFYAGYRILGPTGAPVGALCVFDDKARAARPEDLAPLRDLVLRVQDALWGAPASLSA